jgi:crossover junction endodeoxyribonuclease RuvC
MSGAKIILGIDPGSMNTGYGILKAEGGRLTHLEHGVFVCKPTEAFSERLLKIGLSLQQLFLRIQPDITVIERIFMGKSADSAFKLGHIRGVCLLQAAQARSTIVEYATRSVKKGVTGSGAASKEQVQMILFSSLGLRTQEMGRNELQIDASDALALAYYHARQMEVQEMLQRQKEVRL